MGSKHRVSNEFYDIEAGCCEKTVAVSGQEGLVADLDLAGNVQIFQVMYLV